MQCKQAEQLIGEYLDGRLTAPVTAKLQAHLHDCPACRMELAALQQTLARLQNLPQAPLPDGFVGKVSAAVRQQAKQRAPGRLQLLRWLTPALTLLVVCFAAGSYYFTRPGGMAGKKSGSALMEERAQRRGYANAQEMMKLGGGPWAPPKSEMGKVGEGGAGRSGPAKRAPAIQYAAPSPSIVPSAPVAEARSRVTVIPPADATSKVAPDVAESSGLAAPRPIAAEQPAKAAPPSPALLEKTAPAAQGMQADKDSYLEAARAPQSAPKKKALQQVRPIGPFARGLAAEHASGKTAALTGRAEIGPDGRPRVLLKAVAPAAARIEISAQAGRRGDYLVLQGTGRTARYQLAVIGRSADGTDQRREYWLFMPSHIASQGAVSADYREMMLADILADLGERSGKVIITPTDLSRKRLSFSAKAISADAAIASIGQQAGLRVRMGENSNLVLLSNLP